MKKGKIVPIAIIAVVAGMVMAAGASYVYYEGQMDDLENQISSYQQQLAAQEAAPVASLDVEFNTTTVDHTSTVNSDGSVDSTTDVQKTITIKNTDEDRTATNLKISLYNSIYDNEGLHDNLETSSTDVYVKTAAGVTERLFRDGDYTTGVSIPNLSPESSISITFHFEFEDAVAGTFQDGQSYDCNLYTIQGDANFAQTTGFTVTT